MGWIKSIIITIFIFSGIVVAISAFYGDLGSNYNVNASGIGFLNRSIQISNTLEEIQNRTQSGSIFDAALFVARAPIDAAILAGQSIDVVEGISNDLSNPESLGTDAVTIPAWATGLLIGILMTIVIFTILSLWGKWDL